MSCGMDDFAAKNESPEITFRVPEKFLSASRSNYYGAFE